MHLHFQSRCVPRRGARLFGLGFGPRVGIVNLVVVPGIVGIVNLAVVPGFDESLEQLDGALTRPGVDDGAHGRGCWERAVNDELRGAEPYRGRRGLVGEQLFDEVERLVSQLRDALFLCCESARCHLGESGRIHGVGELAPHRRAVHA